MAVLHTTIEVKGLTLAQWDYLRDNLPDPYPEPGQVRACVQFELNSGLNVHHAEMPLRSFSALMVRLEHIARVNAPVLPDTEAGQDPMPGQSLDLFRCGHHNPPHLYDCRATPEEVAQALTGDRPSWDAQDDDLLRKVTENRSDFPGWDAL